MACLEELSTYFFMRRILFVFVMIPFHHLCLSQHSRLLLLTPPAHSPPSSSRYFLFRASCTIPFNLIAHKCSSCGSYNTRRMGIITGGGSIMGDSNGPNAVVPHEEGLPNGGVLPNGAPGGLWVT